METLPLLLDTDIGSDIDDAVALAYLLRQPRCDLLGITTVSGEANKRAALADALCRAERRSGIPVHVGAELPLRIAPKQPRAAQAEALTSRWPHGEFGEENTATEFLRQTIHSRPGEITLLTIGPLTNIARLFALHPEVPALLKGLTMMGGWYFGPEIEWNIRCDPHAAAAVFAAPVPKFTAVGMDVTRRCQLPAAECRRRFALAGGAYELIAAMAEVWFRQRSDITFHDPLAAALIFEESLCRTETLSIEVSLEDGEEQGRTHATASANGGLPHVATDVDPDAFFAHYFDVIGA